MTGDFDESFSAQAEGVNHLLLERRLQDVVRGLGVLQAGFVEDPTPAQWIELSGGRRDYLVVCEQAAVQLARSEEGTANNLLGMRDTQAELRHRGLHEAIARRPLSGYRTRSKAKADINARTHSTVAELTSSFDDKIIAKRDRDARLRGYQIELGASILMHCVTREVEVEDLVLITHGLSRRRYNALRDIGVPLPEVS